jgi:Fe-S cluster assembly scaffold protein SufB
MSYLWQEFNIKTFPAETLVFRDGVFCEDLSEYKNAEYNNDKNLISVNKTSKLPIHIIYVGEITGDIDLNIDVNSENSNVIMDLKITNKKPAFLNIFVKNTGKNSIFNGQIIGKNHDKLKLNIVGQHLNENTGIFIKTRVAAYKNTLTDLQGSAIIEKNAVNSDSDISFSVMADKNAKIILKPTQYINSVPKNAIHNSSLYKPTQNQINYLCESGLGEIEIKKVLEEAFLN